MPHFSNAHPPKLRAWRPVMWGSAGALLLLPAVAMRLSEAVNWGWEDFAALATLLIASCLAWELALRFTRRFAARVAAAGAIFAGFFLVWLHLAVGL